MSRRDKRKFSKLANRKHKKNLPDISMPRGGRRL